MLAYKAEDWTPRFLLRDKNGYALAKAIETGMGLLNGTIQAALDGFLILDEMPERRLDELAAETGAYYDYDADLETKRAMLREAAENQRRAGTPAALEKAVCAVYPGSAVEEAADYAGEPCHYRIRACLNEAEPDPDRDRRVESAAAYFANVRSVLDGVRYIRERAMRPVLYTGGALRVGTGQTVTCAVPGEDSDVFFADGGGRLLEDGLGALLID